MLLARFTLASGLLPGYWYTRKNIVDRGRLARRNVTSFFGPNSGMTAPWGGRSKTMRHTFYSAFLCATICTFGVYGWGKSKSDSDASSTKVQKSGHHEGKKKGKPGKEMGKGGEDIGKGAAKGTGDMAKGTAGAVGNLAHGNVGGAGESLGKGAGGLGKNVAVGTGKGVR